MFHHLALCLLRGLRRPVSAGDRDRKGDGCPPKESEFRGLSHTCTFLGTVKRFGRLYEAGFVGAYNILSGHLTKDMNKAPAMLMKHKIALTPPRVKGMDKVRKLIKKAEEIGKR